MLQANQPTLTNPCPPKRQPLVPIKAIWWHTSNLGTFVRAGRFLLGLRKPQEEQMDKDRIDGSAKQAKGAIKDAAGKVTGDAKLQTEGKMDKAEGKIQNAVGGMKDAIRDQQRR
jgi:uncharacterized protein YjbJ (UPF0337 family)